MNKLNLLSILKDYQTARATAVVLCNMQLTKIPPELIDMFPDLEELDLSENGITEIDSLAALTKLKVLKLDDNPTENIQALEKLTELVSLSIKQTQQAQSAKTVTKQQNIQQEFSQQQSNEFVRLPLDISPILGLQKLKSLYLDYRTIRGEENLMSLSSLTTLSMNGHNFYPSNIFYHSDLEALMLNETGLSELSFLVAFPKLKVFHADNNYLQDISPLNALINLEILSLKGNQNTDISP